MEPKRKRIINKEMKSVVLVIIQPKLPQENSTKACTCHYRPSGTQQVLLTYPIFRNNTDLGSRGYLHSLNEYSASS